MASDKKVNGVVGTRVGVEDDGKNDKAPIQSSDQSTKDSHHFAYTNMVYGDGSERGSRESIKYSGINNQNTAGPSAATADDHNMGEEMKVMQPVNGSVTLVSNDSMNKHTEPPKPTVATERPLLNQPEFDEQYDAGERPSKSLGESFRDMKANCDCSLKCVKKTVTGLVPFLKIPQYYNLKTDFLNDLIAGLTVGIMQIPQGMAYATLASLPAEYGLYTSLWPVLLYAFLGSSRHVSVGTFAVVSLMVGSAVDKYDCEGKYGNGGGEGTTFLPPLDGNFTDNMTTGIYEPEENNDVITCKVAVAAAVTFVGGLIQLVLGVTRLGIVTIYLSESMTRGFTTGCAIHVFSSQIKAIFGVPVGSYYGPWKLIYTYRDLFMNIGQTNIAALVLSIICMVILWCTKEYLNPIVKKKIKAPIPIDLVVVILGTIFSAVFVFEEIFDMDIVGYIPTGFPKPMFPEAEKMSSTIGDAIAVAIVAFAISVSMAQLFAKRHNYETDSNQELIAHGSINLVCSSLSCYMMCVSLSRSVVCESLGAKSQINALWSAGLMLLVILFIATYFQALPSCVLASIIIVALKGMFMQFKDLPKYWKICKTDFAVWLVTFIAVVLLDVALGLVVGIAFSLLTVVASTQRPYSTCEGNIDDTEIYKDVGVYSKAREISDIKVFRFDGSIYFASKQFFIDSVYEKTECDARRIKLTRGKIDRKLKKDPGMKYDWPMPNMKYLIIDCTTMGYLDDSGVQGLRQVCTEYKDVSVTTFLAGCKAGVREMLICGGFHDKFDKDVLYPTVHDAVQAAKHALGGPAEKPHVLEVNSEDQDAYEIVKL